eukprot:4862749-Prymnesium_polylepis.1
MAHRWATDTERESTGPWTPVVIGSRTWHLALQQGLELDEEAHYESWTNGDNIIVWKQVGRRR